MVQVLCKKRKWQLIGGISIIMVLVLCIVGFYHRNEYSLVIKENWGITLPGNYTELYEADSGASLHGDGIRYHVFQYKGENSLNGLLIWLPAELDRRASLQKATEGWQDEINVPRQYRPDYASCDYYYQKQEDHSELILWWNEELNRLYIVESFL